MFVDEATALFAVSQRKDDDRPHLQTLRKNVSRANAGFMRLCLYTKGQTAVEHVCAKDHEVWIVAENKSFN